MGDGGVASVGRMSTRACSDARRGTDRPPQLNHMPTTIITDTDKEVTVLTSTDVGRQTTSDRQSRCFHNLMPMTHVLEIAHTRYRRRKPVPE